MALECQNCSIVFYKPAWRVNTKPKYCSRKCAGEAKRRKRIILCCANCKKEFAVCLYQKSRKYCSKTCRNAFQKTLRGNKSPYFKKRIVKQCIQCGEKFFLLPNQVNRNRGFCSRQCFYRVRGPIHWRYNRTEIICNVCGKPFYVAASRLKYKHKPKYCSHKCQFIGQKKIVGLSHPLYKRVTLKCLLCKKPFLIIPSEKNDRQFCSRKCSDLYHEGENHHAWKGGTGNEPYDKQFDDKLKFAIKTRDHYKCQICGIRENNKTHAIHHIDYDKKNNAPENLITLCWGCHTKTNFNRPHWQSYFTSLMRGGPGVQPSHSA